MGVFSIKPQPRVTLIFWIDIWILALQIIVRMPNNCQISEVCLVHVFASFETIILGAERPINLANWTFSYKLGVTSWPGNPTTAFILQRII